MKKLSEIDFYMKPIKYTNGDIDKSGIKTRKKIEKVSGLKANELFIVGDTEEGFDYEYMDVLEEYIYNEGELLHDEITLRFDDGYTFIQAVKTKVGLIVKVWSEGIGGGEFATYVGDSTCFPNLKKLGHL